MTRLELSHNRDLTFSGWIRSKLPDSSLGYMVSDIDFVLSNYKTKKVMIVEIKQFNKPIAKWQKEIFRNLHKWIQKGIDKDWKYLGYHLITFERKGFFDGTVKLDNIVVSEQELIKFLSF